MINANMRSTRYIDKVMQEARSDKKQTPSNLARILALLRYLYSLNPTHTNDMSAVEETITDQYDMLKATARRLRQKLYFDNPEMKGLSWRKLGSLYPSVKTRLTLELEGVAFGHGIYLHHCLGMWGADRLLFEAFRSSIKSRVGNGSSNNSSSSGSNNEDTVSLASDRIFS